MKATQTTFRLLAGLALSLSLDAASASQAGVTPVQKVLQMLTGMLARAKDEKHQEQVQYAAYKQWCDGVTVEKQKSIAKAESQIDVLQASVLQHNTEAERLDGEIRRHEEQVVTWANESQAAASTRALEREDYINMHRNYTESLSALDQAIRVLKQQNKITPGAAALVEKVQWQGRVPKDAERVVAAFLAQGVEEPDLTFVAPPLPNAYEFQSRDIINLLEELKDKFKDELRTLENEETRRRHAFEMLTQDLTNSIAAAHAGKDAKKTSQAKHRQFVAAETGELQDTTKSRDADKKDLQDIMTTCQQKAKDFETRQKMRADEITAFEKAMDIIGSRNVAGAAATHLPSMLQRPRRASGVLLAQLRASVTNPNQLRAAAYLREESERLGSRTLSTIAVQARDDPFTKVKKLIQELVERLMAEATAEAEHKGWCDTELATNERTRTTKTREVETLRAEIDGLQAGIAQLGKDLATLATEIAEINSSMAKAGSLRDTEKVQNAATVADAVEGQKSVNEAITVLQNYYNEVANQAALVQQAGHQQQHAHQPAIFGDEPYKGQKTESNNVISFLQVIQSDFARLQSSTEAAEASAEADYRQFIEDSRVAEAQKKTDVEHKQADKQGKEMTLVEKQTDLENAEKQLNAAEAYFEKLRPSCLETGQTYEERVQRRKDEIQALKEALKILSGEDIAALEQQ